MAQIDTDQARKMVNALGADLKWRLAYADDQHYTRGDHGRHWHEDKSAQRKELQALSDQYSWHLRPEPVGGPYQHTMLDDATRDTIERLKSEGLPPTAIVQTSEDRYQVWHRWPEPMNREQTKELLTHLQSHYGTDLGANMPGHCGRLAGSRNWKRDPKKGINRGGYSVSLIEINPPLTRDQANAWVSRYPIPKPQPHPIPVPTGRTSQFDLDDPRYRESLETELRELPNAWNDVYAKTGDAHRADWDVALKAVAIQLSDSEITGILSEYVHQPGRNPHGKGYIALTIRKAREWTGVSSPGVWGGGAFDPEIKFPYLRESQKEKDLDPEAER